MATADPLVLAVQRRCAVCGGELHMVKQGAVVWFTCPVCDFTVTPYELPKPCIYCGREHLSTIACPQRPR